MITKINETKHKKKLSILICSMHKRIDMLNRLLDILKKQLTTSVEIIVDADNGELSIGEKRNGLLDASIGEYVSFIDDDDTVSDDYIKKILTAVKTKPDTCAFQAIITTNGVGAKPVFYSMKYTKWSDSDTAHYRSPQHLSPIKREIAISVRYPNKSFAEDREYSDKLVGLIKSEVEIEGPIYFYDFIPQKSWFKTIIPTPTFSHAGIMCQDIYGKMDKFNHSLIALGIQFCQKPEIIKEANSNLKIIGYQFEQLFHGSPYINNHMKSWIRSKNEIWEYDLDNIDFQATHFQITPKFRPLLYTNKLKTLTNNTDPDIDILFYGAYNARRETIMNHIKKENPKANIVWLRNNFNDSLDKYIERSKIILNIHFYETAIQEQVRMFYPLINGKCVLSEISSRNYYGNIIRQAPPEALAGACKYLLETNTWKSIASESSEKFKDWSNNVLNKMIF